MEPQVLGTQFADRLHQLEAFMCLLKALLLPLVFLLKAFLLTLAFLVAKFGSPRDKQDHTK